MRISYIINKVYLSFHKEEGEFKCEFDFNLTHLKLTRRLASIFNLCMRVEFQTECKMDFHSDLLTQFS